MLAHRHWQLAIGDISPRYKCSSTIIHTLQVGLGCFWNCPLNKVKSASWHMVTRHGNQVGRVFGLWCRGCEFEPPLWCSQYKDLQSPSLLIALGLQCFLVWSWGHFWSLEDEGFYQRLFRSFYNATMVTSIGLKWLNGYFGQFLCSVAFVWNVNREYFESVHRC